MSTLLTQLNSWCVSCENLRQFRSPKGGQARAIDYLVLCASISKQLIGRKAISEFDFYDWLRLEDKHCFKSTFFFMSERKELPHIYDHFYDFDDIALYDGKPRSIRQIMDEINGNGWEIGLHGSYHSAIAPALLKEERECISNVIDSDVISGRQHWLHFDTEITPVRIAEAGLIIDSTHGFNRCIGFRSGTAFSYNLYDHAADKVLSVYEFPQHVMDGALFAANSLEYTEELATRHALELMTEIENVGGIFVLSFHPNYWHAEPAWRRVFENILSEAHMKKAWGCSLKEAHLQISSKLDNAAALRLREMDTRRDEQETD